MNISPNIPLYVCLEDPEGQYDFELQVGRYQTTTGQSLTLPRPAVILLNKLAPRPGEEIVITKHQSGKKGASVEWTISLSTGSEQSRAEAGEPDSLMAKLEASIEAAGERKAPPTPIRKPAVSEPVQPRLFDRGTGTHGPAPAIEAPLSVPMALPAVARSSPKRTPPAQIPANVAVREILFFIGNDPNTANWSDQARQDLASTVMIAAYKAGHIGLWERGE